MKILKKVKSKYIQKMCTEPGCDTPFFVLRNHYKRSKRCPACQKYHERTYAREFQRKYRAKKLNK